MLELIFLSALTTIILTPCGYPFNKHNNVNIANFSNDLVYGIILISFISLLINFFFPLNIFINSLILIFPFLIFLKKIKIYFTFNFLKFLTFNTIIIFLLITKSNVYRPDAMLYHLPYINILNDEKIVFGLSNLHYRFGHTSIIQYFSAFFNNIIFFSKGIVFSIAVIASTIIINFLTQIIQYFKNRKFEFHFFYLFSILLFIAYKMNRYGEYGNDAPTHFLFFFLVSELIRKINSNDYNISNNFILSIFILLNKVTMGLAIFLPFIFVSKEKTHNFLKTKKFYFGIFFLTIWILKNTIISGCLIYPISKLCFNNLEWSNIEKTEITAAENEAWTKGWSDLDNENNISHLSYSKKFFWLKNWSQNHFKKILKILIPYILFLLIIYFILLFKLKKTNKDKVNYKRYLYLIYIMIFFSFLWFLKVPQFRYGYSYLVCLISLTFSYYCALNNLKLNVCYKFFSIILIIFTFIFISKNFIRVFTIEKNIWPQIVYLQDNEVIMKELKHFDYNKSNIECGYGFSLCTHFKKENLKSKIFFSYKMIIQN